MFLTGEDPTNHNQHDDNDTQLLLQEEEEAQCVVVNRTSSICHSERCLVRGQYRRVWRDRTLSLHENGILDYVEHNNNNNNIVKYRLNILEHAPPRILDVTTFRDAHVGLPRGMYGFVFPATILGTNCSSGSNTNTTTTLSRDFYCAVESLEQAQTWVIALQWAATQTRTAATTTASTTPTTTTTPHPTTTTTTTIVTKVTDCYPLLWKWQVMYQIQVLVLLQRTTHLPPQQQQAHQWTLLRNHHQVQQLVAALSLHNNNNNHNFWNISQLDQLLQSIVTDAHAIHLSYVQEFLGFSKKKQHRPTVLPLSIPTTNTNTAAFVKEWLAQQQQQSNSRHTTQLSFFHRVACWCIHHPLSNINNNNKHQMNRMPFIMAAAFTPLLFLQTPQPAAFFSTRFYSFPCRFDVLVASWTGFFYLGRWYETRCQTSSSESNDPPKEDSSSSSTTSSSHVLVEDDDDEDYFMDGVMSEDSFFEPPSPQPNHESTTTTTPMPQDGKKDAAFLPIMTDNSNNLLQRLPSPLPRGQDPCCWDEPPCTLFHVRGPSYLQDRIKIPSATAPFACRGVDVWLTDNPRRHIAQHPSVLGGKLALEDTFLVNFLLPFGNFVAYFTVPSLSKMPRKLRTVWSNFVKGDQEYRDARLKLLPIVLEGPWIVKAAVGPGKSPAVLGKAIPLQYFFRDGDRQNKAMYEVDVIITASSIAKGILSVVKGHTKSVSIGFAFIIEAVTADELPETVLCTFQVNSLNLEECPELPPEPSSDE